MENINNSILKVTIFDWDLIIDAVIFVLIKQIYFFSHKVTTYFRQLSEC